jgi:hypothetical protein
MAKNPMTIDALQRMLQSSIEQVGGGKKTGMAKAYAERDAEKAERDAPLYGHDTLGDLAQQVKERGLGGMIKDIRDPPTGLAAVYPPEHLGGLDAFIDSMGNEYEEPTGMAKAYADQQDRYSSENLEKFARRERQQALSEGSLRYAYYSEEGDDPKSFRYDTEHLGKERYWEEEGSFDWDEAMRKGKRGARDTYDKGRGEARSAYEAELKYRKGLARKDYDYLKTLYKPEGKARKRVVSGAEKIAGYGVAQVRKSGAELGQATRGSKYLGMQAGALHGTLPQSTGALNGVMRGLAGLFILFVFISVFYMVFGPLYDVLITNFLSIIAADGSTMLGGKDVTVLYANTANAILLWVPILVIGGTLYLLISMVFERESKGMARTNEMLAWDALAGADEDMNLDMALEGGFDPMGDFYGPS